MRRLALIAFLAASPAAATSPDAEQAQAAEGLTARAQVALDGILGPGRAKVAIDVIGEHSEISSDVELIIPMDDAWRAAKPKASDAERARSRLLDLPGYAKEWAREAALPGYKAEAPKETKPESVTASQSLQKEHEASRHDAGFKISAIHATVVLDTALDDASVREASQLLPQLLSLDMTRGDTLNLLRAPLRPAWKSAFATPSDWRSAALALGGALVALLIALIVFAGLVGAGRAMGRSMSRELSAGTRAEPIGPPASVETLAELMPGAAGFLEAGPSSGAATNLLGRRFDFLVGREPELIARAVSAEKPEELSVFFGHLAESIPDLASWLFAHLSPDIQAEVSQSLLKLSVADPGRLAAIEDRPAWRSRTASWGRKVSAGS